MRTWMLLAVMLTPLALGACSPADREKMLSTDRAPLVGRCDPQPGYPDPSVRKGCETQQLITRGR